MDEYTIRSATKNDLAKIHDWLKEEHTQNYGDSFLNNFNLINDGQASGSLLAMAQKTNGFPVAFSLGETNIDIFAVHHCMRRKGVGRYLAQYVIDRALSNGLIGLYHECSPSTSIPFWREMGFQSVRAPYLSANPNWVALALPRENELEFPDREIAISLSDFEDFNDDSLSTFLTKGKFKDGSLHLARDFSVYSPHYDSRLKISIDGIEVCRDKAKYLGNQGVEFTRPWIRIRELKIKD